MGVGTEADDTVSERRRKDGELALLACSRRKEWEWALRLMAPYPNEEGKRAIWHCWPAPGGSAHIPRLSEILRTH